MAAAGPSISVSTRFPFLVAILISSFILQRDSSLSSYEQMIFSLPTGDKAAGKEINASHRASPLPFNFRALATWEVSILFQSQVQNIIERNRLFFRKTVTLNLQRREAISARDSITDEVY